MPSTQDLQYLAILLATLNYLSPLRFLLAYMKATADEARSRDMIHDKHKRLRSMGYRCDFGQTWKSRLS